jgi:hypothetical protein
LFNNLKLNDTPLFVKAMNIDIKALDETLVSYLKGIETMDELIPLNSKARFLR